MTGAAEGDALGHTEMLGETGQIQDTGSFTISKKYFVALADLAQLQTVPAPPAGFRAKSLSYVKITGGFEKTVVFESFTASTSSPVVENRAGVEGRFELESQDEFRPIEAHPDIAYLVDKYQGQEKGGKVNFPREYTPKGGGGLGSGGGKQRNPMFGVFFFPVISAIFRHTFQVQEIPTDIWTTCGKVIMQLPANFPSPPDWIAREATGTQSTPNKSCWLTLSPQIARRGGAYEIVRAYRLLGPNETSDMFTVTQPDTQ